MISDVERNYQPREWEKATLDEVSSSSALGTFEMTYFCNSDSQRFKDMCLRGSGDRAILLDYEILSIGYEPTCGSMINRSRDGRLILTIFTEEGNHHYIEKTPSPSPIHIKSTN